MTAPTLLGSGTRAPEDGLARAARLAWQSEPRCIGRRRAGNGPLAVVDARHADDPAAVLGAVHRHYALSTNGGRVVPTVTVFRPGVRVHHRYGVHYAGHQRPDGVVVGDAANVGLTEFARDLGWRPPAQIGRFDRLPFIVSVDGADPRWHDLPAGLVREVPLDRSRTLPHIGELGLRWYALPVVAMDLVVGRDRFPSIFSGWLLDTEIGAFNLAARFGLEGAVARLLRLPPDLVGDPTLQVGSRVALELNQAATDSYRHHGVRIAQHVLEARQFVQFELAERARGRGWWADWPWVVPPASLPTAAWHQPAYPGRVQSAARFAWPGTSPVLPPGT
jgi:nitric-oxide synthase